MGALILIKPVFIVLYKRETVTGYLELSVSLGNKMAATQNFVRPQSAVLDVSLFTFDRNICTSLIQ